MEIDNRAEIWHGEHGTKSLFRLKWQSCACGKQQYLDKKESLCRK